jgi:hypothetical protein
MKNNEIANQNFTNSINLDSTKSIASEYLMMLPLLNPN